MSDFAQSGLISTLQQLNSAHLPTLEKELGKWAKTRPIALILPCHGADLERPAMAHIVEELRTATFLSEIVISVNGTGDTAQPSLQPSPVNALGKRLAHILRPLPQPVRVLWNDQPQCQTLLASYPAGKGLNVWSALGILCQEARAEILVLQDCDVASFRRSTLARLCYACAHPQLGYAFAKMYYSRATDRLYGRVSRLFFAPLLQAIVRLVGHHPLIDFLSSFRYPLAGECALTRQLAQELPLQSGWGLETGMLCDVFRQIDPRTVCQVDGGSGYDHKHQPAASALAAMCSEIARTLLGHLAEEGIALGRSFHEALAATYRREASQAVRQSANLALINGLPFDAIAEQNIVENFARQLGPFATEPPSPLPSWSTQARTAPQWVERFLAAVNTPPLDSHEAS